MSKIPKAVWVLGFVSLFMDVSSEMIHSLLPLFMVSALGTSTLLLGVVEGLAEGCALVVKVFSGVLSDYLGRRKALAVIGYSLGALTKPLFAVAHTTGVVLSARLLDRVGKGIRGAPRDALVADFTPPHLLGSAYGLRQSLDTVGAFLGPAAASLLMWLWLGDFRAVFWVAMIPGVFSVLLLIFGLREPPRPPTHSIARTMPITRNNLRRLSWHYWWVVATGALFTLARFSKAFLLLRAQDRGISLALVPLILVLMNVLYALTAYPFGKLADRMNHMKLLMLGLGILFLSDLILAQEAGWMTMLIGVALWGIHLGITQGLLSAMIAAVAPQDLRGTAFGLFHLVSGIATLAASVLAGLLWDHLGAPAPFYAGALFCLLTFICMVRKNTPTIAT